MKYTLFFLLIFCIFTAFTQNPKWHERFDKVYKSPKYNQNWHYVKRGKLYGAVDVKGEQIVPVIFTDIIENDFGGALVFGKDGKWGTFSPQGNKAAPFMYDKIIFGNDRYGTFLRNNKWGYMDTDGEEMIPPQFDEVSLMSDETGFVRLGEKWAIINREGIFKTNFIFDSPSEFQHQKAIVTYKGYFGQIDTAGKWIISPTYNQLIPNQHLFNAQRGNFWGFINEKEEIIIPFEFEERALGSLRQKDGLILAQKNGKWGYFNAKGEVIVPFENDDVVNYYTKLGAIFKNNKWIFVDNTGKRAVEYEYEEIYTSCWGEMLVGVKRDGKWTFMSEEGKELLPPSFEYVECLLFDGDPSRVKLNGKWGYINQKGEIIVPCEYDEAAAFSNYKDLFELKKGDKIFFFDKKGNEVK